MPEGARFCTGCGAPASARCTGCGIDLVRGARFCHACGARVASGPDPGGSPPGPGAGGLNLPAATTRDDGGEIRQATILFADVVGYTSFSAALDPDDVHQLMRRVFAVTDSAIQTHGGVVDKHLGDGVMAVFGLPRASEDDPLRAIRAALEFQRNMLALNRTFALQRLPEARLRVGINTGRVLAGGVGASGQERSVVGDAVNVAARLQTACVPGGVLVSHETYRHVRGLFDVVPQAPISLKGLPHPLTTYLVKAAKSERLFIGTQQVLGHETALVGRDREMAQLWAAFDRSSHGNESVIVTIVGPAGLGKSRLLHELHKQLETLEHPIYLLRARASTESAIVPYDLLGTALKGRAGIRDEDEAATARQKLLAWVAGLLDEPPRLWGRRRDDPPPPPAPPSPATAGLASATATEAAHLIGELLGLTFPDSPYLAPLRADPVSRRDRSLWALERLVRRLTIATTVIELEDVQWADRSSLDVFLHLHGKLADRPLFVLATARPEAARIHPEWSAIAERRLTIPLAPLQPDAARELAEHLLQYVEDMPPDLAEEIAVRSAGTPYFAEEMVKSLADLGALDLRAGRWRFLPEKMHAIEIPSTVEGLLQARLDRLSETELRAVRMAAVVGKVFWDRAVSRLWEQPDADAGLAPLLAGLVRREMVVRRPVSTFRGCEEYAFIHDLMRDVAYRGLVKRVRRELHGLVASWLEAQTGDRLRERASLLGYHWHEAGEVDRARLLYLSGARDAAARYAHSEAERLLRAYLSLVTDVTPEAVDARVSLAVDVLHVLGRNDLAKAELLEALEAATTQAYRAGAARALLGLATVQNILGETAEALASCQAGLATYRELGEQKAEGDALCEMAHILMRLGRLPESLQVYEQALALHRALGERRSEGQTLSGMAALLSFSGKTRSAADCFREAIAIFRELGDRMLEGRALGNLALCQLEIQEDEQAEQNMRGALEIYRVTGDRRYEGWMLSNLGTLAQKQQGLEAAEALYQQALGVHREVGNRIYEADTLVQLANLKVEKGELGEARALLGQAEQLNREAGNRLFRAISQLEQARLERWIEGDAERGAALLEMAEKTFRTLGAEAMLFRCAVERGHVALAAGGDGRSWLAGASEMLAEPGMEETGELRRELEKLELAVAAQGRGEVLVAGECPEHVPRGIRALAEHRGGGDSGRGERP